MLIPLLAYGDRDAYALSKGWDIGTMTGQGDQRNSDSRQKLLRLMMSALDFRHALSAATFLLEDVDWTKSYRSEELRRFKCYETTMVVSYARPFTQARGHGAPFGWKLIKPAFQINEAEAALHSRMMDSRNRLHAHSDGDTTLIRPEIWRSDLPNGSTFDFLAIMGGEQLVFAENDVEAIHAFLWKLRHHVDNAVQSYPAPRDGIPIVVADMFGARTGDG